MRYFTLVHWCFFLKNAYLPSFNDLKQESNFKTEHGHKTKKNPKNHSNLSIQAIKLNCKNNFLDKNLNNLFSLHNKLYHNILIKGFVIIF
jgi:hypothetical protein